MKSSKLKRLGFKERSLTQKILLKKSRASRMLKKNESLVKKEGLSKKKFSKLKKQLNRLRKKDQDPKVLHENAKNKLKELKSEKLSLAKVDKKIRKGKLEIQSEAEKIQALNTQLKFVQTNAKKIRKEKNIQLEKVELESLVEIKSSVNKLAELFDGQEVKESIKDGVLEFKPDPIFSEKLEALDISQLNGSEVAENAAPSSDMQSDSQTQENPQNFEPKNDNQGINSIVNGISTWNSNGYEGIELSVTTRSGESYTLELLSRGNKTVDVRMNPESEKQRRKIWAEKKQILNSLSETGYKVNAFRIGGSYARAA